MKHLIKKLVTTYEISNGKETIEVEIHNGKMTLANHKGYEEFVFVGSDPEKVKRIADLFKTATTLVKREEIEI